MQNAPVEQAGALVDSKDNNKQQLREKNKSLAFMEALTLVNIPKRF
jgi:hypothetical protein